MEELAQFDWVHDSAIGPAACITLVEGADVDGAAWGIGGDIDEAVTIEFAELYDTFDDAPSAVLRSFGPWTLAVEYNGFQGSRPEVLRRLSANGQAVSAFWNVKARNDFSYAVDGVVRTTFEAMSADHRYGAEPDRLESIRAGLAWDDPMSHTVPLMLALIARITGIALGPPSLAGPFTAVPLVPWPQDVPDEVDPRYHSLTRDDPALSAALQTATPDVLRAVARAAVRHAATVAGLASDPTLAPVLVRAGTVGPVRRERLDRLSRTLEDRREWPQFRTIEAARWCTSPSPLAAAFGAIEPTRYAVIAAGADPAALRAAVRAEISPL